MFWVLTLVIDNSSPNFLNVSKWRVMEKSLFFDKFGTSLQLSTTVSTRYNQKIRELKALGEARVLTLWTQHI